MIRRVGLSVVGNQWVVCWENLFNYFEKKLNEKKKNQKIKKSKKNEMFYKKNRKNILPRLGMISIERRHRPTQKIKNEVVSKLDFGTGVCQ